MSSLYKRANSNYYWWTSRYKGRRLRKSTKMTQRRLAINIQQKWDYALMMNDLDFIGLSNQTSGKVDEFFDHYLLLRSRKSEKTYLTARGMIDKFRKYLLKLKITQVDEIKVTVLDDYIEYLQCSPKTKKNHMVELSQLFNQALKEDLISSNPVKLITLPVITKKDLHRPLDRDDLRIIFAGASGWLLYYLTLFHTGLRAGDVAMLKYGNIDRERRAIISLIRKSRRTHEFPLSRLLMDQIPDLDSNSTIFPELYTENERKLNDNLAKPRLYMQALLKAENRKHATLHSFRVTYNNNLLGLGCSIQDRQKLLAHSSSETTKIYTHPNFELAQSYVDQLPDIMGLIECDQNVTKM